MKKHLFSLVELANRRKTIVLLVIATLFITVSIIIGTADNLPMIGMLFTGLILFYFAILHPWKKASRFAILTAIFIIILITDFLFPFINEDIAMSIGFGCLAGIIAGIIGIFSRIKGWQRLPFTASLVSLLALGFIGTNLGNPSKELIAPTNEWILIIGLQILVTILLICVGLINKRDKWYTKSMLITTTIVLVFLSIWGFHTSSMHFGKEVGPEAFEILLFRIIGSTEIITAALSLYSFR